VRGRALLALALGALLLVAVLMHFDLAVVMHSLRRVGTAGFTLILVSGLAATAVLAAGLYPLLPRGTPLRVVFGARQLRDSSADVLPITQVGGMAVAVRALVLAGLAAPTAFAAVIADVTTELFAQGCFTLIGVAASLSLLRASAALSPYIGAILGGAVFLSLGSIGFAILQLRGSRLAEHFQDRFFAEKLRHAGAIRQAIHAIYARHSRIALSVALHLAGWMASGLWLWAVMRVMGIAAPMWKAIAMQALVEGLRSATVFIPASVGIQEAGYAALAPVFGFTPEIGIALSLLRRARDLVVGAPVLLIWQAVEGRSRRNIE
jgi:putative membrane protein